MKIRVRHSFFMVKIKILINCLLFGQINIVSLHFCRGRSDLIGYFNDLLVCTRKFLASLFTQL